MRPATYLTTDVNLCHNLLFNVFTKEHIEVITRYTKYNEELMQLHKVCLKYFSCK